MSNADSFFARKHGPGTICGQRLRLHGASSALQPGCGPNRVSYAYTANEISPNLASLQTCDD
jgi:hypothetical protein